MVFALSLFVAAAAPYQQRLEAALELERRGEVSNALEVMEQTVTLDPTWQLARLEAARLRLKVGTALELAGWHADIARSLAPENARAHYLFALTEDEAGRRESAMRSLEVALVLRPDFAEAQLRLAGLLSAAGNFEHAVPLWKAIVAKDAADLSSRLQLAAALQGQGATAAAEKELRALIAKPLVRVPATRRLIDLLSKAGRTEEAHRLAKSLEAPTRVLRPLKPSAR